MNTNDGNRPDNIGGGSEKGGNDSNPNAPREHQEGLAATPEGDGAKAQRDFVQAEQESVERTRALGRMIRTKLAEGGLQGLGRWLAEETLKAFDGDVG